MILNLASVSAFGKIDDTLVNDKDENTTDVTQNPSTGGNNNSSNSGGTTNKPNPPVNAGKPIILKVVTWATQQFNYQFSLFQQGGAGIYGQNIEGIQVQII